MPVVKRAQRILLDTHVWLWLAAGDSQLSLAFHRLVNSVRERDGILISAISVWEIGMLAMKKRIKLDTTPLIWIEAAVAQKGITLSPIVPQTAINSSFLPGKLHGDPADRMLVATAQAHNVPLVTADAALLRYGRTKHLRVIDPRS